MKLCLFGSACLMLATLAFGVPLKDVDISPFTDVDYRLPANILPSNYVITLRPYLLADDGANRFTFDGETYVTFQTSVANLSAIVLHSKNLTYSVRELYNTATPSVRLTISSFSLDDITDKYTLNLENALAVNTSYTLHFVYTGLMEDDMHGFYRSSYVDESNNTKWLGSTQFETNHARRAFPSFDEPTFKATFDVTLVRHRSFKTISNSRIVRSEQIDNNYWRDVYARTPTMSTYLLAFLVSEFNERTDGEFYVAARPEYYDQTEYAFDVGRRLLLEFDRFTTLPYYNNGIDKMHMAAIPDFSAGAMENWGLLTYRERSLLYNEGSTTLSARQSIAAVIAHEQAHMWFGDLVTCDWWSYTWLNEGFARYFQYYMTAVVHPEWEMEKQFVVDQIQTVFTMDSTNNTNPMTDLTAASPSDLSRMFNSISYNKGGSVIRMVRFAIGAGAFQRSLQSYLTEFQGKTAFPKSISAHWINNWPAATRQYADGVITNFTEMVGYPVIHINVASDFRSMTIKQKRFLLNANDGSDPSLLYTVPITYTTNVENDFDATTPKLYLEARGDEVEVTFPQEINWIIGNVQETGYYRVNYSVAAWHRIHQALHADNWSGIHELNRAQFVDDLLAFARAGEVTYNHALGCLDYLQTEINYLPWTAAFNGFNYLAIRLGVDYENFGYYIISQTRRAYAALGFEERSNDTTLEIYARSRVIAWVCKYGNENCISSALSLFRAMNDRPVPVNIRGAVYCTAMRDGNEDDFNMLYNRLRTERVPTEQVLIINNLGCVRDRRLVNRYFDIIVSDEIRRQDKSAALSTLYAENAENISPVFELVTNNVDALAESLGSYSSVATVISNIASRFTTEAQRNQLESFIARDGHKFGSSVSTLYNAVSTVRGNLLWATERLGPVRTFLSGFTRDGAASTSISVFTVALVAIVSFMMN